MRYSRCPPSNNRFLRSGPPGGKWLPGPRRGPIPCRVSRPPQATRHTGDRQDLAVARVSPATSCHLLPPGQNDQLGTQATARIWPLGNVAAATSAMAFDKKSDRDINFFWHPATLPYSPPILEKWRGSVPLTTQSNRLVLANGNSCELTCGRRWQEVAASTCGGLGN